MAENKKKKKIEIDAEPEAPAEKKTEAAEEIKADDAAAEKQEPPTEDKEAEKTADTAKKTSDEAPPKKKSEKAASKKAAADAEPEKLRKELAEANDKWLRTAAEYDNFRRRSQKEKEAIYGDSKSDIVSKFLPVLDNFERAAASSADDFEGYKKGIEMTVKQLLDVFTAIGIESFGEKGDTFDPNIHNGVMHIDDDSLPENSIADVFMKGYKSGDRIIRPAMVKVAN